MRPAPATASTARSPRGSLAGDDAFDAARYANAAAALATTGFGAVAPLPRDADVRASREHASRHDDRDTFRDDLFAGAVRAGRRRNERDRRRRSRDAFAALGAVVTVTGAHARRKRRRARAPIRCRDAVAARRARRCGGDARSSATSAARRARQLRRASSAAATSTSRRVRARSSPSTSPARCAAVHGAPSRCSQGSGGRDRQHRVDVSFFGGGHAPGYCASKGGVAQLTRRSRIAYAPRRHPRQRHRAGLGRDARSPQPVVRATRRAPSPILARTPLGRWGEPEDVAGPVVFLCSPAAASSPARCCRSTAAIS